MSDIIVDPRDAFEKIFPPPKHVIRCGNGYACTEYNAWGAHNFIRQWEGWSAAMLQGVDGNSPVIPDGWVACSERMPEEGAKVLVIDGEGNKFICWHKFGFWADYRIGGNLHKINHWMPLPAAPQQNISHALAKGMERYGDAMQELAKREVK